MRARKAGRFVAAIAAFIGAIVRRTKLLREGGFRVINTKHFMNT